jgi:hypothetical protein
LTRPLKVRNGSVEVVRDPDIGAVESDSEWLRASGKSTQVCAVAGAQLGNITAALVSNPNVGTIEGEAAGMSAHVEGSCICAIAGAQFDYEPYGLGAATGRVPTTVPSLARSLVTLLLLTLPFVILIGWVDDQLVADEHRRESWKTGINHRSHVGYPEGDQSAEIQRFAVESEIRT